MKNRDHTGVRYYIFTIIFIFLNFVYSARGGEIEALDVLGHLQSTFAEIMDYRVQLHAEIDMDQVRIPPMDVIVYFKQPDKFHLQSKGFSMLPRLGLFINPNQFTHKDFSVSLMGKETLKSIEAYKLELVPRKEDMKLRKFILWVDPGRWILLKVHTVSWQGQSAEIDFEYALFQKRYWLPASAIATINLKGFKGFSHFHGSRGSQKAGPPGSDDKKGRIIIQFTHYEINVGLSDSIFEERNLELD